MGHRPDLTSAIVAFTPRNPDRPITDHAFKGEFLMGPVPAEEARQYLCSQAAAPTAAPQPDYYGVIFTFRIDGGGRGGRCGRAKRGGGGLCRISPSCRSLPPAHSSVNDRNISRPSRCTCSVTGLPRSSSCTVLRSWFSV